MKGCKLTDSDGCTYNSTQWGEGVTHKATGKGVLSGPGWLHYYDDHPELAAILAPLHCVEDYTRIWECIAEGKVENDRGLKYGCTKLTTVREIPMPEVSITQRVAFGILCAMEVCREPKWLRWAECWLSGDDRSKKAAREAKVYVSTDRAASWAAGAALWAGIEASWAAGAASWAGMEVSWAGMEASWAGTEASWVAGAAVEVIEAALGLNPNLDLKKLAQKAMEY